MTTDGGEAARGDFYRSIDQPGLSAIGRPGYVIGYQGSIDDELHPRLRGRQAARTYRQMSDNDPTVNAFSFAVDGLLRRIPWRAKPAKVSKKAVSTGTTVNASRKAALKQAEFLRSVMGDMNRSWRSTMSPILRMIHFGYTPLEIVWKIRGGLDEPDPRYRSQFDDGKLGIRRLSIRMQETVVGWTFDDEGDATGMIQEIESKRYTIPIGRLLLFAVRNDTESPEGRSLLRGAYRPWFFRTKLEEFEAVGAERDLVNIPVMQVPQQLLAEGASDEDEALARKLWKMLIQIRRNHREGVMIPSEDLAGNDGKSGFKLGLLKSGGDRAFDVDVPIKRHRTDMATAFLCGFLLLGQDARGGSRALGGPLIRFFLNAIEYIEDEAEDVVNKQLLPRLETGNGVDPELWPTWVHGNIERVDVKTAAETLALIKEVVGEKTLVSTANAIADDMDLVGRDQVLIENENDKPAVLKQAAEKPNPDPEPRRKKDHEEGGEG